MTRLPAVSGKELIHALERLGFQLVRTRGSHHDLRHPDGRATAVAAHSGETLGRGVLSKILRDVEVDRRITSCPLSSVS